MKLLKTDNPSKKQNREWIEVIIKLSAFVLIGLIVFNFIIGVTTISSEYMEPNIKYHDNVLYSRMTSDYFLRDVVVYEYNGEVYVGRVVGMPGDTIAVDGNGNVFQNGHLVYEQNIFYTTDLQKDQFAELKEDEYYVLADNRPYQIDSRSFGAINKKQIKGVSIMVIRRFGI